MIKQRKTFINNEACFQNRVAAPPARAFSVYEELLLLLPHGDLAAAWDGGSVGRRPGAPAHRAPLRGVFGGHVPAGALAPPVVSARGGQEKF